MVQRAFRRESMQATLEIAALLQREYALTFEYACIAVICATVERAIVDALRVQADPQQTNEACRSAARSPLSAGGLRLSCNQVRRRRTGR
jgi:hypothetical protein